MSEHLLFHLFLFHASVTWYFFPIKYLHFVVNRTSIFFIAFFGHISYLFFPLIYENPKIISQLVPQNSKVVWSIFCSILVEVIKKICLLQAVLFPRPQKETMLGMPPNYLIVDIKWEDGNTDTCNTENGGNASRNQDGKEINELTKHKPNVHEIITHASDAKYATVSYEFSLNEDEGNPRKYNWICDIKCRKQIKAQQLAVQLNYKKKHQLRSDLVFFYLLIVLQEGNYEESLCQPEQVTQLAKYSEGGRGRLISTPSVVRILNLLGNIREGGNSCGYLSSDPRFLPSRSGLLEKKNRLNAETNSWFVHHHKVT